MKGDEFKKMDKLDDVKLYSPSSNSPNSALPNSVTQTVGPNLTPKKGTKNPNAKSSANSAQNGSTRDSDPTM